MLFLPGVAAAVAIVAADESSAGGYASCMNSNVCMPISDIPVWWVCMQGKAPEYLILAGAMIFFATFLPRVLLSFMLFILSKFPFVREIVDDYVKFCTTSTTYLLSASLCMGATIVALLSPYLCRFHIYVWGIFFLMWIYSVFNVIDRLAVRRFGGKADNSKKVVISESIKLLRLLVLVIASMYIYLQMWQDQSLLKYSFLGMIGGAIALGFAGATHNAVGGLYLVLNAPFRVDEFIQVGQVQGHVQRVALRFTVVLGLDRTKIFVPNSYFLYKPMVNFSQRPKRQIALDIHVHPHTSVAVLETLVRDLHVMLQSRHMGLTSHDDYNGPADKAKFCFVTMDALYSIRLYTYTDELDAKKHAMIRSEVWLAAMEIMEDLGVVTVPSAHSPDHDKPARDDQEHGPCAAEYGFVL
ncbi:hypothetical protein H310_13869 [Aphanomyces invadans]|uniref:Mechanosensitive ion channel MscS domain-containing protein n=1 Tax=Aphanomyces invadans TaxID=157072 RepID=A0A024TC86_9STRA|nr:hypothetical protein H310_13869 [Aphanomyces invadans]ETV91619.1 hypothetical protein H310_13869 [Aphanomyces invadans]|eukprot:XP_008879738.1 hypothetical protein H310_13869 [Aphanomyces invadans]